MSKTAAIKRLYKRFETPIKYALFGTGTAIINFGIFFLGTELVHDPNKIIFTLQWWEIVNMAAWLAANVYSFHVNRRFVFKSKAERRSALIREIAVFFGIRLISFFISAYIMSLVINLWDIDHQLAKLAGVNVEVVINYFTCKIFVFRKQKKN